MTLADARLIRSAHDCSDGGLAVTLAECCFGSGGVGAEISIEGVSVSADARVNEAAALFGESASRVIVSLPPDHVTEVLAAGGGGARAGAGRRRDRRQPAPHRRRRPHGRRYAG